MHSMNQATAPIDLLREIVVSAQHILVDEKHAKSTQRYLRRSINQAETGHADDLDGFFEALDSDALLVAVDSLNNEDAIASNCAVIATCLCDAFRWLQANPAYVSDITNLVFKVDLAELLAKVGLSESPRTQEKYAHAAWAMLEILFVASPYIPTQLIQTPLNDAPTNVRFLNEAAINLVFDEVPTEFSLSEPTKNRILDSTADAGEFSIEVEEDNETGLSIHVSPVWFGAPLGYYKTSVQGDNVEFTITGGGYCHFRGEGRYESFLRLLKAVTRGKVTALCP